MWPYKQLTKAWEELDSNKIIIRPSPTYFYQWTDWLHRKSTKKEQSYLYVNLIDLYRKIFPTVAECTYSHQFMEAPLG